MFKGCTSEGFSSMLFHLFELKLLHNSEGSLLGEHVDLFFFLGGGGEFISVY